MSKKVYLANAFSIQMLPEELQAGIDVHIWPLSVESVKEFKRDGIEFESAIGHADTAAVVSSILDQEIKAQRINLKLQSGDTLVVAQLMGGRLPEGSTTLPDGFSIKFFGVKF